MSNAQTRDQRRANDAWQAIERIDRHEDRAHIVRAAKKLPIRIHTAGLGHAVQFVNAKKKTRDLGPLISCWVLEGKGEDLVKAVREGTADSLRRHTNEALAWLQWFNRFAEAKFPKDFHADDEGVAE
jgi:CRISPR-associated protein Cmr5